VSKTGNPVGWISPLGLPIVQPYRKETKIDIIKTISHKMQVPKEIENVLII
jgi:DNA-directed RNA polymerase